MATEQDQSPDYISALPTELRCAVTRNVKALDDRKSLVLVSRTWAEVSMPLLWDTFTTDLLVKDSRNILGLTHPASNIIKHVQKINLLPGSQGSPNLPNLVTAIPRGQLKGFTSADESTMHLLLLLHPRLVILEVPTWTSLRYALTSPWTMGSWANLHSMKVHANSLNSTGFQIFWNVCTNLKHVELKHDFKFSSATRMPEDSFNFKAKEIGPASTADDITVSKNGEEIALKLESLQICKDVQLPRSLDSMFCRIDALALHELSLDTFTEATELLEAMASQFAKGSPCLKRLNITNLPTQKTDQFVQGLFVFLASFCGLQKLHLHCLNCHKIDMDGIANHGEYLQTLFLIIGGIHRKDATSSFDGGDLQKLAIACPKLEHLSLNLYETGQDKNEGDILGSLPNTAHTPNAFEEAMKAIANLASLRTLRLSNPPEYRKAFQAPGELWRNFTRTLQRQYERQKFQARADGIIQYLGEHGSKIKGLAFVPTEDLKKADGPDQMGHVWPNYYYYRGDMKDRKGRDVAVARAFMDWNNEFPDAAI